MLQIPLHKPQLDHYDREALVSAFDKGHIVGNGKITKDFQKNLQDYLDIKHVFFVTSGTAALELALMTVGLNHNVALPNFTFTSVVNSVIRENSRPHLVDIENKYFNIDTDKLPDTEMSSITTIVPVHYAGMPSNMEFLMKKKEEGKIIIEDGAHAIGAEYKNKKLGTFGNIGCYSFHASKNLSIGEGGAIVTNDSGLADKMEIHLEKGTNRSSFFRGEVDKYGWVDVGSSFIQSDLLASIGISQLKKLDENNKKRSQIAKEYSEKLEFLEKKGFITLPKVPDYTKPNWHIYAILANSPKSQNKLLDYYKKKGIGGFFHYPPLSSFDVAKKHCSTIGDLTTSIDVSSRLIRLPIYPDLKEEEIDYIVLQTREFFRTIF
jgi:dTDP-4-amino-4,6-dideoxygalactose transaminase